MQVIDVKASGYAKQFDQDCQARNCAIISGYDPKIDKLTAVVNEMTGNFLRLPDDVLAKYKGGQRRTTYQIQQREVDSVPFYEVRKHLMVGDDLEDGNPLTEFRQHGERLTNIDIKEGEFKDLVPLTVELYREIEKVKIQLLKDVAVSMGLPSGYWAARYAWGDHAVRTLLYEPIGWELKESGVPKTIHVYGTPIKGVKVHSGFHNGEHRTNMIRASPHKDIDTFAALLKATQPGFVMQQRDGTLLRYTAQEGSMLLNAGRIMEHETSYINDEGEVDSKWRAGAHWVEIANPLVERILTVMFGHFRESDPVIAMDRDPKVLETFPDTVELLKLKQTLIERGGYFKDNAPEILAKANRAVTALPSRKVFRDLIKYEKEKGLVNMGKDRLLEFEDQEEELYEAWKA